MEIQLLKRFLDIVISIIFLVLLFLPMVITAICIAITMGSPILFKQPRPGLHGRIFTLYKFRTMKDAKRQDCTLLPDSERLTRLGNFLRSSSIDELPELWNVLKGDMSLVGPRPLLSEYLDRYTPEQARRHDIRPGITGLAQVNGRNNLSWGSKFKLDVWYVDNQTFMLDVSILFSTVSKVLKRDDISQSGQATVEPFMGYSINERINDL
ncbi:MAG: sugar transferase [Armatimonadota bacterium]